MLLFGLFQAEPPGEFFCGVRDAMAAGKTTAIIYAGGTEQNGPHMSLVKHNLIAHHVAGQIAEKLKRQDLHLDAVR